MNIYVGNLSRSTSEDSLRKTFEQFGEVVSVKIIKDRLTGELRGFAFLEMPGADEASQAIAALNGRELDGRKLVVNEAREREARPARSNGGGNGDSRFSSARRNTPFRGNRSL
jgi:RNA recognition motif-containing protein